VKVNQIGTITENARAVADAQFAATSPPSRTGRARPRTPTIADLAVATNAGFIKTGSLSRSDRIAKYNRLLRIEEDLGACGVYPGLTAKKA